MKREVYIIEVEQSEEEIKEIQDAIAGVTPKFDIIHKSRLV